VMGPNDSHTLKVARCTGTGSGHDWCGYKDGNFGRP
jgi:hypothetical protein